MLTKVLLLILIITSTLSDVNQSKRISTLESGEKVHVICTKFKHNPITLNYNGADCYIITNDNFVNKEGR